MIQHKESSYQTYLRSEVWKCKESPSGAHSWVENRVLPRGGCFFQCVHCKEKRVVNGLSERNH